MRIIAVSAAAALMIVSLSASLVAQRPADPIHPKSMALLQQGRGAQAEGKLEEAHAFLESAVVVDPRNRQAFVLMAEIAQARGLPGQSIRLYREALALDPNDAAALRGQGEAMVAKGALERARENLAKIEAICRGQCKDAAQLAASIAKGPPVTAAQNVAPTPPAAPAAPVERKP